MTLIPSDVVEATGLSDGEFKSVEHPFLSLWLQATDGRIRLSIGYTDRLPIRLETCRGYEVIHDHSQQRLMNYVVLQENSFDLRQAFSLMTATAVNWSENAASGEDSLALLLTTILDLKTLFSQPHHEFTDDELRGHIAELLTIRELIHSGSSHTAVLDGWKAPSGSVSDFVFSADQILEVKSTRPDGGTITISNVAQLDPESGSCQLVVWPLASRPSAQVGDNGDRGVTVVSLTAEIRALCASSEAALAIFDTALSALRLNSDSAQLRDVTFTVGEALIYDVTETFPCLRSENVPPEVRDLAYTLRCNDLREFGAELRIPALYSE